MTYSKILLLLADDHRRSNCLPGPAPIDLLFTDLVMPGGVSEIAFARQAQNARPGSAIRLTTGYAGMQMPPADEFPIIAKPLRSTELSRTIDRIIGHVAATRPGC